MKFTELREVFGSRMKALEVALVLEGVKPLARHIYTKRELSGVREWCGHHGLFTEVGKQKVDFVDSSKFSNKGSFSKEGRYLLVYIAKDELVVARAHLFELKQDHRALGSLLGYPECCVKFFIEHQERRARLDNDFAYPAVKEAREGTHPFVNNVLLREKDACLLSHFPCRLDCVPSQRLGELALDSLEKLDRKEAERIKSLLQCGIVIDDKRLTFS